jgi:antitoxin component YwqK of YwqJK toxin-antitoxin module
MIQKGFFKEGKENGKWEFYDDNGSLQYYGDYSEGKMIGDWYKVTKRGKLKKWKY